MYISKGEICAHVLSLYVKTKKLLFSEYLHQKWGLCWTSVVNPHYFILMTRAQTVRQVPCTSHLHPSILFSDQNKIYAHWKYRESLNNLANIDKIKNIFCLFIGEFLWFATVDPSGSASVILFRTLREFFLHHYAMPRWKYSFISISKWSPKWFRSFISDELKWCLS